LPSSASILIDAKNPNLMKHGKLWKDNEEHGCKVDAEVKGVIFSVETSQHKHDDWKDG